MDLKDKTGTAITSQIKITLSLASDPDDNLETFMASVDAGVSHLDISSISAGISALGMAVQLMKNIMDEIANVSHRYFFPICHRSNLYGGVNRPIPS